jgi:hypothetical protein
MLSWLELERLKRETVDLGGIASMLRLTAIPILSQHITHPLWADAAAIAVPMPIDLYFRNRIVLLGMCTYGAFLIIALGAAVLLGI